MEFKTWIEVSVERMETLKALELPDVFTTDLDAGRIRVVEQSEIRAATFHQWNKEQPTLAIVPTSRPLVSFHPNIFVVPYSDHSSYQELEDFVSALQPTTVVPIVGNHIPGSLSALLPSKKRPAVPVPESVLHYMLRESASLTHTQQVHATQILPVPPRGVIFESPGKESLYSCEGASEAASTELDLTEEVMDTESNEAGSNCILIDLSMELVPETHTEDTWSLDDVSDGATVVESVPPSQLTQSRFVPAQVASSAKAGLDHTGNLVQKGFNQAVKDTAVHHPRQQRRRGNAQSDQSLSGCDGMIQRSGDGIDQEDDIVSNDENVSQHRGHLRNNREQRRAANKSWNSARPSRVLQQEHVEEIEDSILNDLPFSEEDLKPRLLQQGFVQRFAP